MSACHDDAILEALIDEAIEQLAVSVRPSALCAREPEPRVLKAGTDPSMLEALVDMTLDDLVATPRGRSKPSPSAAPCPRQLRAHALLHKKTTA